MADLTRKTANLFDKSTVVNDERVKLSGTEPQIGYSHTGYINITGITALTVSSGAPTDATNFYFYNSIKADADSYYKGLTAIVPSEAKYVRVNMASTAVDTFMLNAGQTAKPYEPYGWLHSLRKLTTATEAVENPLYSDGTAITAYTLKGNTVQDGTPSPSNPVEVQGVGVRTAQLFDGVIEQGSYDTLVTPISKIEIQQRCRTSSLIDVSENFNYTASLLGANDNIQCVIHFLNASKGKISEVGWSTAPISFTTPNGCQYIALIFKNTAGTAISPVNCGLLMVNEGSTPLSYEPYGYKIPISNGGVTTNIYLGSTQTVRQIKKLVLTGQEDWTEDSTGDSKFFKISITGATGGGSVGGIMCSHFVNAEIFTSNTTIGIWLTGGGMLRIRPSGVSTMTKSDFTTWLSQQYANGTPVTVWYVLATPQTTAVNEPLMKIGNYVDTLSNATSIPTTEGANSITVDTTVQPSEFTATWTGWHDSSVKEWDGAQWNE